MSYRSFNLKVARNAKVNKTADRYVVKLQSKLHEANTTIANLQSELAQTDTIRHLCSRLCDRIDNQIAMAQV